MTETAARPDIPGAMQDVRTRILTDGGIIQFSFAPAGWLTQAGEPRRSDWRAYHYTAPDGTATRFPSVSTLLDSICPKPGLVSWSEKHGIIGAVRAVQLGEIDLESEPSEAVARVRALRLGADAARDEAAERGLDIHGLLERYMLTGETPRLDDYPIEHAGYVQAAAAWLLHANPEPIMVEELVCHPQAAYAGRSDLVAIIGGIRTRADFKTSQDAAVYSAAHYQIGLYEHAAMASGDEPTDTQIIVVLAANGEFRAETALVTPRIVEHALAYYRDIRGIDSFCASNNRAEKKARL